MSQRDVARAIARVYLKQAAEEAAYNVSRDWDAKQQEWRQRMGENIDRWTDNYNRNVEKIDKINDNLEKLSARLEKTRDREQLKKIKNWIDRDEDRLSALSSKNRELKSKIQGVEQKLNQGGEEPWFYREQRYARGGHYVHHSRKKLNQPKSEARHVKVKKASDDSSSESKPVPREKSFLEILFGL